ncbi:hypothetical protein [Echinicola vietnamensis]|uniref:Uncharacterized protein n=1 Tax=Echinicola vietnamensis (strain DSM 17526 / LMG 23754 / KMM 6221) TaxID=926556 RepID=L0FRH0_ECHVK|nr:hypothetical protein [Echinicola vietnamensis]AGA76504.1 hypothetical protein Echvi_0208 [Echinicola vietnamensis DSM 17526]
MCYSCLNVSWRTIYGELLIELRLLIYFGVHFTLLGQAIPDHYSMVYEQDFSGEKSIADFEMTDSNAWSLRKEGDNYALEISQQSDYVPPFRSPFNIAVIKSVSVGSFILEAELQQTGKEYGHRDLCIFFGMKTPANFYYTHIASIPDPHAHNIFLVNDAPRVAIGKHVNDGIDWGSTEQWHKVRVVRNLEEQSIKVYFDDMTSPIMETTDSHFETGQIGFGTFDDVGKFDNIKIWAPELVPAADSLFGN